MKQHLRLSGGLLSSVAGVLIAQAPVSAAPTKVTGVQVSQANNGVNIVMATEKGDRPQVFGINSGNTYQATITNTQLRLRQGNSFRQDNPAPGISSVEITQVEANSIRVVVAGTNGIPNGQFMPGQGQSIVLSVAGQGGTAQSTPATQAALPSLNQAQAAPPPPPGLPLSPTTSRPAPQIRTSQNPDVMLPNPEVTVTRNDRPPLPSEIQSQNNQAPPFQPRAVAPPLGDIAVSNIAPAGANIELSSAERIPRLVLRDAPVRDVLALLARAAGLNIAFTGGGAPGQPGQAAPAAAPGAAGVAEEGPKISLDIENESVQDVFNYVLRISGLQANRVGRTIFVGSNLPLDSRNIIVRTLRLNQVRSTDAANFLSAQGAETQLPITRVTIQTVGQGNTARDVEIREPDIKAIGAKDGNGPLLLRGLSVLADARLNSITLVGDPRKVDIAVAFLTQLDLRRRQVAVNVKVIDVNLTGANNSSSSFSFGINNNFFVNDNGVASLNFGGLRPATETDVNSANNRSTPPIVTNPIGNIDPVYDRNANLINVPLTGTASYDRNGNLIVGNSGGVFLRPTAITGDPSRVGLDSYEPGGGPATFGLFPLLQYPRRFLSALRATISTRNAKILTDPTLVVQEGETANVNLTEEVIANITSQTQTTGNSSTRTVTAVKDKAGLQLAVAVDRIDDNGFVSLRVNPTIRAISGDQTLNTDGGNANIIRLLAERSLQSGLIRLRDGQTLIVSGIIRDQERVEANKIPILGDLPIIGSLFRKTTKTNERAEVILLLTPQILDDSDRSNFGYQNNISPDARQMLQRSQPVQPRQ
ncbi:MAG: AMIN domain-containing protein [Microcoleus sp. PH2017_10_PVI_O_A]|uniref:type IV pilus secretin family protein n=1 Tax=unclassified Microcoleus TaxID=2642155 RepID=UPI001DD5CE15|nr:MULTISPECIES: type IV pilus secretin family protein [unclassified Microcoleus]TAE84340.1 MAG: type IV pilus secretin family protein [Oscillatoriales cyanobacterium]MCC3405479.1 AMIN domain-containing protein [Microcoleus sp. PH2017_10_PVI_O_A]MCC3461684.1 AMIN domain-containing protein [Microcoleus sp. PH2017_11_PCY_U_A]MCC3477581.1 AMIN domain-containing protein [Microcoleus sp. PH2017_12_PCY_D_A]MCC3528982.1 AMIN domain-containing protein [Microcoleus sp. PH2017_21_RUC_O_A]